MNESEKKKIRELLTPDANGNRMTLQAVGNMFGVTRERIRQINGNVGRHNQAQKLKAKTSYWRKKLYSEQSVAIEDLARQYRLCRSVVAKIIGGRCAYEYSVGKRKCNGCDRVKRLNEFYPIKNGSLSRYCKKCDNARTLDYYHKNQKEMNRKIREWRQKRCLTHSKTQKRSSP